MRPLALEIEDNARELRDLAVVPFKKRLPLLPVALAFLLAVVVYGEWRVIMLSLMERIDP